MQVSDTAGGIPSTIDFSIYFFDTPAFAACYLARVPLCIRSTDAAGADNSKIECPCTTSK